MLLTIAVLQEFTTEQPCEICHIPEDWSEIKAFDHSETGFQLQGQHGYVPCADCHVGETLAEKHHFAEAEQACSTCHFDPHSSRYGAGCERCHTSRDWLDMNWREAHDETFFPLLGAHRALDCVVCHQDFGAESAGINRPDSACRSCHDSQFEGVEAHEPYTTRFCDMCHNPFAWTPAQFELHDIAFGIYSGAHAGRWTGCNDECHRNLDNYADFSCGLNGTCHKHDKNKMDSRHNGNSGYAYESHHCYGCHH